MITVKIKVSSVVNCKNERKDVLKRFINARMNMYRRLQEIVHIQGLRGIKHERYHSRGSNNLICCLEFNFFYPQNIGALKLII